MSGIYQKQVNSGSVTAPGSGNTLISVNESGELFTKESSGAVTVYGTGGGGGGAAFPFTGSADISGTLNVDFTDAVSFITDVDALFPKSYQMNDRGTIIDLNWSGSAFASIVTGSYTPAGSSYVLRNYIGDGDTIIPGMGSFPTQVSEQSLHVPHYPGSLNSGSILTRNIRGYDQTAMGGGPEGQINDGMLFTADDGTHLAISTAFTAGGSDAKWNIEQIRDNAEDIILELGVTGFQLSTTISDTSASLLEINNVSGTAVMQFFQEQVVSAQITNLNYANDIDAAAGGVPVGGIYNNAGALRIRMT